MKIIDTHQHLLYPDRFRYPWCQGIPALESREFRLEEYRAAARQTGISETLFMEVDVDESQMKAETDFFLQLAEAPDSGILGVLGACRPEREDFTVHLESILHPKLRGLRRILHTQPDDLALSSRFARNLAQLQKHNLTFDLCLLPRQLPLGVRLAKAVPNVQFVLDHCGVPNITEGPAAAWREHIRELAQLPNVACKISGVVAYCHPQQVTPEALQPFVQHCIECFGWERVLFGGDWPVCNLTSSLARWVEIAKELLMTESVERQEKFFAGNAERIYRVNGAAKNRFNPQELRQAWPRPTQPRPIVIIGAGDIVRDAHLPGYMKAGFPVAGVFDVNPAVAEARAKEFQLPRVFRSIKEAIAIPDAVFDIATPPKAHEAVLAELPDGAAVMVQKPMGCTLGVAERIVELCRRKRLTTAVNFQFRFSAYMLAIHDFFQRGEMGEITDVEVHLNVQTPWDIFPFLLEQARVEILVHTIHYLDLIRHFLNNPRRVYARTVKHQRFPKLASARSSIILDYGDMVRCCLSVNHCHPFGERHSAATIRIEGTEGCAVATLGLLMNYPRGLPDRLDLIGRSTDGWVDVPLTGRWFPDAFIGTMSNLQRFVAGEDSALVSPVADALQTMRLVEACYLSDERGGTELNSLG